MEKKSVLYADRAHGILPAGNGGTGNPYPISLDKYATNLYFTDPENAKKHKVEYFVSGDAIHVLNFKDGAYTITKYEAADEYLKL